MLTKPQVLWMTNHTPSWEAVKDHSNISGMILTNIMNKINDATVISCNQMVKSIY